MSGRLRILDLRASSASLNMATDEAILCGVEEGSSPPTLRLYTFSPPAITLGRFQRATDDLRKRAEGLSLEVVRRPTGGRAVVHGSDLAYSLVASVSDSVLGGSIKETYRKISERLLSVFSMLGIDVSFAPGSRLEKYQRSASCFDTSVLYELRKDGEKVAGSAQTRQGGAFLQQGTIALARSGIDYTFLFGEGTKTPDGLLELCGRRVCCEELVGLMRRAFDGETALGDLNARERRARDALVQKYQSREWNQFGESHCAIGIYEAR